MGMSVKQATNEAGGDHLANTNDQGSLHSGRDGELKPPSSWALRSKRIEQIEEIEKTRGGTCER